MRLIFVAPELFDIKIKLHTDPSIIFTLLTIPQNTVLCKSFSEFDENFYHSAAQRQADRRMSKM